VRHKSPVFQQLAPEMHCVCWDKSKWWATLESNHLLVLYYNKLFYNNELEACLFVMISKLYRN
jgi:hypothetical protein